MAGYVIVRLLGLLVLAGFAAASGRDARHLLVWWDSQWYAGIARDGYGFVRLHEDGRVLSDYAFFPLYPLLERLAAEATGLSHVTAGLVISWAASFFAAWGIFAIGDRLYGRRVGVLVTVLWASLPVGIVQSMAYSESLFTALAAWALYAVITGRWVWAGLLGSLAGLTRPVGVAVVAAVVIPAAVLLVRRLRWSAHSSAGRCNPAGPLIAAMVAPLGWLGYVGWVGVKAGTPTRYFDVTAAWGNRFDAGISFARWTWGLLASRQVVLGLLLCLGVALLIWVLILCIRQRQPLPLLIFTGVLVFVALTTSGYFGSKPRYLVPAFPLLFPVAGWLARQRTAVAGAVVALAAAASAIYGAVWLLGPGPP